jgi:predicted amidophosphoribosyltransferase
LVKCPGCGEENQAKFRLCGDCGTPLGETLDTEALHEDDALRAVRAAGGMQKIVVKLNKGRKARFGCEL